VPVLSLFARFERAYTKDAQSPHNQLHKPSFMSNGLFRSEHNLGIQGGRMSCRDIRG
jgi:hypothetical protein